jgi:Na+-translocating ferredoxin:NAD+ oxidoreductase RnfC subunit
MHHSVPLLEDIQNASLSNISSRMIEEDELQRVLRISLEEEQARLYSTTQREREQREAIERANEQAMHLALQQSFEEFNQQQLMGSPSIAVIQQANLQELEVARMASLMDRYESNEVCMYAKPVSVSVMVIS